MEDTRVVDSPPPGGWVRIKDATEFVEFEGELIASISGNANDEFTRWTDLALYRKAHGGYVLQSVARSILYHKPGICEHGIPIPLGELADRYSSVEYTNLAPRPCPKCQPIDVYQVDDIDGAEDVTVEMEVDWYKVRECYDVDALFSRLRGRKAPPRRGDSSKSPDSTVSHEFGKPATALLERAKEVDVPIRNALSRVRRI